MSLRVRKVWPRPSSSGAAGPCCTTPRCRPAPPGSPPAPVPWAPAVLRVDNRQAAVGQHAVLPYPGPPVVRAPPLQGTAHPFPCLFPLPLPVVPGQITKSTNATHIQTSPFLVAVPILCCTGAGMCLAGNFPGNRRKAADIRPLLEYNRGIRFSAVRTSVLFFQEVATMKKILYPLLALALGPPAISSGPGSWPRPSTRTPAC